MSILFLYFFTPLTKHNKKKKLISYIPPLSVTSPFSMLSHFYPPKNGEWTLGLHAFTTSHFLSHDSHSTHWIPSWTNICCSGFIARATLKFSAIDLI